MIPYSIRFFVIWDKFLEKRAGAVFAREKLIHCIKNGIDYKEIKEILEYDERIGAHNIEQLASRLLFDLTRNKGFEVSKGTIGDCWIISCCEWKARKENDVCGLDYGRLTKADKLISIFEGTCLKEQFRAAGLEAAY